jgi:hypothetical protein
LDNKHQYIGSATCLHTNRSSIESQQHGVEATITSMATDGHLNTCEDDRAGEDEDQENDGDKLVVHGMEPEGKQAQQQPSQTNQNQTGVSYKNSSNPVYTKKYLLQQLVTVKVKNAKKILVCHVSEKERK